MAYEGNEVRVHDNNDQLLNKLYLRLNEDRRILKEDGFMVNSDFLVSPKQLFHHQNSVLKNCLPDNCPHSS